jgi:hypothetical protein
VVSPSSVAFNSACNADTEQIANTCNVAQISAANPFKLISAYFAGAYSDGLQLSVTGYLGANVVDSETLTVNYSNGATLFGFNWHDIDRVSFESWGGAQAACCGSGSDFTMDNLTISGPTATPEPSLFAPLLALGLGMIVWRGRRRYWRTPAGSCLSHVTKRLKDAG